MSMLQVPCFSQDLNYFNYDKQDWTLWEDSKVTSDFLTANKEILENFPYYDLLNSVEEHQSDFHLVDIDNDNINELIYNGWSGGEGELVIIYKRINHKYIKQQVFFGRILDLKKSSTGIELVVLDYSCCAGYVDHVEVFRYNFVSKQFEIINDIAKLRETEIPSQLIKPIRFEIVNTPYYLRYSPEILTDLDKAYLDFDPIEGQNIAAIYEAGDRGIAYAESTDSTGRIWWLVIMDQLPDNDKYLYYEGNNDYEYYRPVGWISSKYLKIVK